MQTDKIRERMKSLPEGDIGLYIRDTATGETITQNEAMPIEAASVIKLTVMAEAFRQREAGLLDFEEEITIRQEDKLPSCGALTYLHTGLTVQLGDLVTLMIILSDNTATNLLIDRLGIDSINRMIDSMGMTGTRLNRKLFRPELAAKGIRNTVSAADIASMLQQLLDGTLVSEQASKEMLAILGNQRLNGKMPFYLHSRGIKCAHKTGEDSGVTHDVGIIYADTPRIFCFLSQKTDVPRAELALQELADMISIDE